MADNNSSLPDTPARRTIAVSRARAAAAGAYKVELLKDGGFVLAIRKGDRTLAVPAVHATSGEILGMAAAPALARALSALLLADTSEKRIEAEGKARVALFAAGVPVSNELLPPELRT